MMRSVLILALVGLSASPGLAQPKLTAELGEKVRSGIGTLTEQDVLKLVPGSVAISSNKGGFVDADLILTSEEATKFDVVLINGKVASISATFNYAVASKSLTFEKFKQIKEGMTQKEVEQVLGKPNGVTSTTDNMKAKMTNCGWFQGRKLVAYVKDGKVNGSAFIDTTDK
jgi:hypothetical protein